MLALLLRLFVPALAVSDAAAAGAVLAGLSQGIDQMRAGVRRDIVFDRGRVVVGMDVGVDDGVVEMLLHRDGRRGMDAAEMIVHEVGS
ncbi:hypothetical protein D9M72_575860 [compost metagenome]